MEQMYQKWDNILELIFNNPNEGFTVRKISKEARMPTSTIQRYLKQLRKKEIIDKENKFIFNNYSKFQKIFFVIDKLYEIELINYIEKELNPSLLIVFGSIRKGEYDKDSDIDIFVETTVRKKLNLNKFEKRLKHKIDLFIESDIKKLNKNLFNNVVNGIKLTGYLDL